MDEQDKQLTSSDMAAEPTCDGGMKNFILLTLVLIAGNAPLTATATKVMLIQVYSRKKL